MRFHLFGLANVPLKWGVCNCPFTTLAYNMAKMLKAHGHEVVAYGVPGSDVPCDEFVQIVSEANLAKTYNPDNPLLVKWQNTPDEPTWQEFRSRGARELKKRYRRGDIALISFGHYQGFIADNAILNCEFLCGYSGVFTQRRVFPSYFWMSHLYGQMGLTTQAQWYDAVIPHYLDMAEFDPCYEKDDYFVCLGRLNPDKGTDLACDLANEVGTKLYVVGCDESQNRSPGWLVPHLGKHAELVGVLGHEDKVALLRKAKAVLMPCRWTEAFGMVQIEAMACGTPVITTDWGSFPEVNIEGVTGYRCRDWLDLLTAAERIGEISPQACRARAESHYSLEAAYPQYERYFWRLERQNSPKGWYWCPHPVVTEEMVRAETDDLRAAAEALPPLYVPEDHEGRGIVICAGGDYLPSAYVALARLRELGCELSVELWRMPEEELTPEWGTVLEPLGVTHRVGVGVDCGFFLKSHALAHTDFSEALLLDADNVPAVDPTYLFDSDEFQENGLVFWPDDDIQFVQDSMWTMAGIAAPSHAGVESGQMLVDVQRAWKMLHLALHMNQRWKFFHYFQHGDKDTFLIAALMAGQAYTMCPPPLEMADPANYGNRAIYQHDPQGNRVFQHRMAKWKMEGNPAIPEFWDEARCVEIIAKLAQELATAKDASGFDARWAWACEHLRPPAQNQEELRWMYHLFMAEGVKRYMEIGSCFGGSFYILGSLCKMAMALDLPGTAWGCHDSAPVLKAASKGLRERKVKAGVLLADSHAQDTLAKTRRALAGKPLDSLYIDGDHSADGCHKDWEMYAPLVRPGGMIFFHDISCIWLGRPGYDREAIVEVKPFFEELAAKYRSDQCCMTPGGDHGTGVIWVPEDGLLPALGGTDDGVLTADNRHDRLPVEA